MNDENSSVRRGMEAIGAKPIDHVDQASQPIQEELDANSQRIQDEVAAKSAINVFDSEGNFETAQETGDADSPVYGYRLSYGEDEQGKTIDAWETSDTGGEAKLARQRRALAQLTGLPEEEITNEDVFAMGRASEARARQFFQSGDGINRVDVSEDTGERGKFGRSIGQSFRNSRGEDARVFLNNPLDNAAFNSDFNRVGRAEFELGSTDLVGNEKVSDFDARNTTSGKIKNIALLAKDAGESVIDGIGDLFANNLGKLAGELVAGESDITPEDETQFAQIQTEMFQARKEAQLELDKRKTAQRNRVDNIELARDEAIKALYGDTELSTEVNDIGGFFGTPIDRLREEDQDRVFDKNFVDQRADEILRERLSPELTSFLDGTGTGRKLQPEVRNKDEKVIVEASTTETVDDRFETLNTKLKVRKVINDVTSREADNEGVKADQLTNPITGAPENVVEANRTIIETADADLSIKQRKVEADKLFEEGKPVQAVAKFIQGGAERFVKHPEASFLGAVESLPEMAALIAVPTLAITSKTHENYEGGKDKFFKSRGRFPNQEEQGVLLATSTASALIEKVGADFALKNKLGRLANEKLTGLISSKLGVSAKIAASMAAASVVEGGEEALVSVFEQVGVNQGTDKLIDSDKVYQSFVQGMATGGAMRSVLEAPNVPQAIKDDIKAAAGFVTPKVESVLGKGFDAAKVKVVGVDQSATPAKRKEVVDKVVADVAKSNGVSVDEVLTPNVTLVENEVPTFVESTDTPKAPKALTIEEAEVKSGEAIEALGAIPDDALSTTKGVANAEAVVESARLAFANSINAIRAKQGDDFTPEQIEIIQQRQATIDHARLVISEGAKALETSPVDIPTTTEGVGELITRGSVALAKLDTTQLTGNTGQLITRLARFDQNLSSIQSDQPKSFKQVQGEVLGTRTNSNNKAGLGQHLSNLGAAIASNNPEVAVNAVGSIRNFRRLQEAKHKAISAGYDRFQKTGKEQTVKYGKGNSSEFIVRSGATQGILDHIQKEINLIKDGEDLARDLGEAHFNPAAYQTRKAEENREANNQALQNPPTVAGGVSAGTEGAPATDSTEAQTPTQRTKREIGREAQSVNQELSVIESQIAGAPTKADQDALIAEQDRLLARREILRAEFNGEPAPAVQATEVSEVVTPEANPQTSEAINNSPEVPARAEVTKSSTLESSENRLFSDAAIEAAIEAVKTKNAPKRGDKASPLFTNIIDHGKAVRLMPSTIDSNSAKALRPLGEMIQMKYNPETVPGIIKKSNDLFADINAMSDDRFTTAEWDAVTAIRQFTTEFSQAMDVVMPSVSAKDSNDTTTGRGIQPAAKGEGHIVFRELANRSPAFQFMDGTGQLSAQVKDAMSVSVLQWVKANGAATMYQTPADVYRFFGLEENQGGLTDDAINAVSVLGAHATPQALSIGRDILDNLNIKQASNPDLDGLYETRLAQSLGDLALVAMSNMTTSPVEGQGEARGYIEFNSIPVTTLNNLAGKPQETDVDASEASAVFVRLPLQVGENGLPLYRDSGYVLGDSLQQLTDLTRSTAFKNVMNAITGTHRSQGGVTALPKRKVPEYHTGTSTKLTPLMKDYVQALNAQTLVRNPQWDLMKSMGKEAWLKLHGWVEPTIAADGTTSFPEMHDAHAISANGKNMGLEREYAQMLEHEVEWASGEAETRQEIARVVDESLVRELKGEDTTELTRTLARLDRELEGYVNSDIHLEHHVISTGRVNDRTSTLSVQRSKMHRNALSFKDHVETIEINNPAHQIAVVAGLVEPLDLDEASLASEAGLQEFHDKYLDGEGNAADPVIRAGIEAIQKQLAGEEFSDSDITDAVLQIGEGAHTLSGLMVVANWSTAIKEGKDTFESHGYTEVDGTTNGVIASMRQLVGGFNPEDTNPAPGSKTARVRSLFNAGGQIFKDQDYIDGIDYLRDNPDAYQNIGILASERLGPVGRIVRDQEVGTLRNNLNDAQEKRKQASNKTHPEQTEAQENLDAAQSAYGVKVFESTLPNFGLVNGKVTKEIRNMMKAIVMPGGYQAGDTALANSLFNAWLDGIYTDMGKGEIEAINETLNRAGLPEVTAENAKQVLPAETLRQLRYVYNNSMGKQITAAYRESMGDFNENAKAINAAYGVMSIVATEVMKSSLSALERKKGSALTNEEIMNERKRLQAEEGVFIGYRQSGATSFADSVSIVKDEKAIVSRDRGGYVTSAVAPGAIRTNHYAPNESGMLEANRNVPSASRTSRIKEFVPTADIGVAGMITSIIGIDSVTQARSLMEGNTARGNVFDANITGFLDAQNEAVTTNRVWNNIHESWSVWDAVNDQLQHLLTKYPEAGVSEINQFFKEYAKDEQGVETGNKFAPVITNADGSTENFSGIRDFLDYFEQARQEGNAQRIAVNESLSGTAQHRIMGGTYKHGGQDSETTRGSSDQRVDTGSFDKAFRHKATPETVSRLFYGYLDNGNISDSSLQKERLTHLMDKHVIPLVSASTGYRVLEDQPGNGISGGAVRGKNIFIRPSDQSIRLFSTDMSDAEVLTHEFLHPIVEAGLKDNSSAITTLNRLQQQVIKSSTFTPESLIDPADTDQVLARKKAQTRYDYITQDIHEFMVFGLSNEGVRTALENELVDNQPAGIVDRLLQVLSDLVARLTGQVIGRTAAPVSVASNLDQLINSFDTTSRVHLARKVGSVVNNKYVTAGRGFLADKVAKPLNEWGKQLSFKVPVSKQAETGQRPTTAESLITLSKTPIRLFDTGYQKAAASIARTVTDHKQDFFSKLGRETLGPTAIDRPYHLKLSEVNEHVDSASLRISSEIKKAVANAFTRPLKSSEQKMLADTVLRGDLKVFKDLTPSDLATLISDTTELDNSIKRTLSQLQSTDKTWINDQARNLGSVMAQGKALIPNGNLNAFNIATGVSHSRSGSGLTTQDTDLIDQLKSMYAIKFMDVQDRNQLAEMIQEQPKGILTMMEVDKVNHDDTLAAIYRGDRSRVVAGEVISKSRNRSSAVILPRRDHGKHIEAGYTLVKDVNSNMSLYTRPDIPAEGYQKGIFSMGNAEMEGTVVKPENRSATDLLLPIVSGGQVVGYRAILDKETRELDAGMSIGAMESLGNHGGRTHRLDKGASFNDQILDMARRDYIANGSDTRAFIKVSINSTNPQVAEFARLMPRNLRERMRSEWGGDMYLRKNQLDLLLGFRKLSLIDEINRRRVSNGQSELNGAVTNSIRLAGDIWQGAIAEVKKRTVLFTPAVVTANFVSNLAVSVLHGMNPVDVVRDQREGWQAIRTYTRWQDELAALDLAIKLGEDVQANTAQRKRVQIAMESSGVHNMVQAGLFQTIVEDIDISANEAESPLNAVLQRSLPDSVNGAVESVYQSAPDSVKKGVGVVMLSPSTEFGKNVQAATAYSDFMARYAMMKHLHKQGVSEAEAINQVMDIYVDYAPNTSRELQYINDSGLYMYTKFLMRIQRVIMRAFRKHPEAAVAFEAAQQALGNVADITDSSLLWGISMSGGRTQTPDEVLETLTELPLFHLIGGLKDVL